MSQLIRMRQRMKAITTIKKITSAMRLISRSFHSILQNQREPLKIYQKELCNVFEKLKVIQPNWRPHWLYPKSTDLSRRLVIIIGSQKGLCGNFNAGILYWISQHAKELILSNTEVITLGKKVFDQTQKFGIPTLRVFGEIKIQKSMDVTNELVDLITKASPHYTEITVISNYAKSFFTPETRTIHLVPLITCDDATASIDPEDYVWSHISDDVLQKLALLQLQATIYRLLIESFLSEQATRFIAMDAATRNANTFLDSLKLQYNKLRQAKITKELVELSSSFDSYTS